MKTYVEVSFMVRSNDFSKASREGKRLHPGRNAFSNLRYFRPTFTISAAAGVKGFVITFLNALLCPLYDTYFCSYSVCILNIYILFSFLSHLYFLHISNVNQHWCPFTYGKISRWYN